ncbi:MAG: hypothetical protein KKC80_01250 [Candidatus Margulisbacteria bacterium]|nr:hypothetical protein [Candidatus Margulisiibacteriota bacterium]MBU1616302.1 hypothetical protein [Candidatus Margulisiibacteriota bacterium]
MIKQFELDDRKKQILECIVRDYLHTAEPVGSRMICRSHMEELSPATIRNEMSDLEEMGLIVQPHTSAGRIPTDLGYRYYVDNMMKARKLTPKEEEMIGQALGQINQNVEEAVRQTLKVLSHLLEYASLIATLGEKKQLFSSGLSRLVKQPEFADINTTRQLLSALEEEDLMVDMVKEYTHEKGLSIHIGNENKFKEVKNYSVVMNSYDMKNGATGGIGIIGPTRMSYARASVILEALADRLSLLGDE